MRGDVAREQLVEGPSRTGKSLSIGLAIFTLCEKVPSCKVLMVRKTLKSMRDTVLDTMENEVFPTGHPALKAHNRHSPEPRYPFPNGSVIICNGLNGPEDVERIKSSEYDVIWFNEATEGTLNDWELLLTRLSGKALKKPFAIADCNPDAPAHWLNQRAKKCARCRNDLDSCRCAGGPYPVMGRLRVMLDDNPRFVDQRTGEYTEDGKNYVEVLDNMDPSSVRYRRMRLGLWVGAEGQIWENFNSEIHIIDGELTRQVRQNAVGQDEKGLWQLYVPAWGLRTIDLTWFAAGVDWGYTGAGVILAAGMDADRNAYIVHQVCRVGEDIDWWAKKAVALQSHYGIKRFACDPSRPEHIAKFNKELWAAGGVGQGKEVAVGAKNDIAVGLSIVRSRLHAKSLYILRDSLESNDKTLVAKMKPLCLQEEIPSYVYADDEDGTKVREEPEKDQDDHCADALRYLCMFLDGADWQPKPYEKPTPLGSYASLLPKDVVARRRKVDPRWVA